jgi:hypothetical protein
MLSAIPSMAADTAVEWSAQFHGGYDNEVLADPDRTGVVEPLSSALVAIDSRLELDVRRAATASDRFSFSGAIAAAAYGRTGPSADYYVRGRTRYFRPLGPRTTLHVGAGLERYRRDDLQLLDLDLVRFDAGLTRRVRAGWLAGGRIRHTWLGFPGRFLDLSAAVTEADRQLDVAVSLVRNLPRTGYIEVQVGYRHTSSNDPLIHYRGPLITVRSGLAASRSTRLMGYAVFGGRSYRDYPILVADGGDLVDSGERRDDGTWRLGMELEHDISPRARLFLLGSLIHQTSNIDPLAFNQARMLIGLRLALWRRVPTPHSAQIAALVSLQGSGPPGKAPAGGGPALSPQIIGHGVRFRCVAPGAKAVAVVGGFNRWDPGSDPLTDPDGDGIWEATVDVNPGIWRYAFVVDGDWVRPQGAQRYEDDGFGGVNGILEVLDAGGGGAFGNLGLQDPSNGVRSSK